jgi:hypothetical protein
MATTGAMAPLLLCLRAPAASSKPNQTTERTDAGIDSNRIGTRP